MVDCEKCKYYHDNCDSKVRCRIDVEKIRAEAIDELRDAIIEEVKGWYWDREMQDYHPDCDLFVNYFIVTTKDKSQQLKEKNERICKVY